MAGSGPHRPLNLALSSSLLAHPPATQPTKAIPRALRIMTDIPRPRILPAGIVTTMPPVVQDKFTPEALNRHARVICATHVERAINCLLYTSPSPRDRQ